MSKKNQESEKKSPFHHEQERAKEGLPPSNFRVEVKGKAGQYLEAIKLGTPRVIGVGYYEDMHPLTVISAELLPGVSDFQIVIQINSIFEHNQAINFKKLVETLSHEFELLDINGFPVFKTMKGTKFTLENTRHNGFRVVVNAQSVPAEVELLLAELSSFLEAVIEHAYLNCGIFPLEGSFQLDLQANVPKKLPKVSKPESGETGVSLMALLSEFRPVVGQGRTFDDIAGNTKTKKTAQALAEGIRDEERRKKLGIRLPKGILFKGPPGTGKTLMAEAMANAGACRFLLVDADMLFKGGLVGNAETNTKLILEDAKNQPPGVFTIIFFDDLDLIVSSRDLGIHETTGKVMGLILSYMDGINRSDNVMFIGATNRPRDIDNALIRPGRFNMQFEFQLPDAKERQELFKIHIRRIEEEAQRSVFGRLNWEQIIKVTEGMSQATISAALENANFMVNQELLLGRSKRTKPLLVNQAALITEILRQKANQESLEPKKRPIGLGVR